MQNIISSKTFHMNSLKKILLILFTLLIYNPIVAQSFIKDLETLESYEGNELVHLAGYFTDGDFGNGLFVLKETNESDNGGTIFSSQNPNKKWFRIFDGKININWFNSERIKNDRKAIIDAIKSAKVDETVYIPSGNYNLGDSFIEISKPVSIVGEGITTILNVVDSHIDKDGNIIRSYQSIFKIKSSDVSISNLKIKGNRISGISIETPKDSTIETQNISLDRVHFEGVENLNQCIHLFICSYIRITNCSFKNTGYQIIQQWFKRSNDVLVSHCLSNGCSGDFIELNSETGASSKNWIISNNIVKNLGTNLNNEVKKEARFIGITNTDGVIITNNIIENTAGDATFHFEKHTGKILISNNVIRNPHGKFGRLIFNVGSDEISTKNRNISFVNNYVEIKADKFIGDADRLIYSSNFDESQMIIKNNTFINRSSDKNLDVIVKSFTKPTWKIIDNEFENFNTGIKFGTDAGHNIVNGNNFLNLNNGIETTSNNIGTKVSIQINNNSFRNVSNIINDNGSQILIQKFSGNLIENSNLDYINNSKDITNNNILLNTNSVSYNKQTNYKKIQTEDVLNGTEKVIYEVENKNIDYSILCWVEITSGSANRTKDLVKFGRHLMYGNVYGKTSEVLSHSATGNWPLVQYDVNEKGLKASIQGSNNSNFVSRVQIIDIEY